MCQNFKRFSKLSRFLSFFLSHLIWAQEASGSSSTKLPLLSFVSLPQDLMLTYFLPPGTYEIQFQHPMGNWGTVSLVLVSKATTHHPHLRKLQSPSPCGPCIVPLGTAPLDPGNLPADVSETLNAAWRYAWISLEGTILGVCKHRMCWHSSVPQSSFSIILLTNNHFKDATSDSP